MSDIYMDFFRDVYGQCAKYGRLLWNNLDNRLVKLVVMGLGVLSLLFLLFMLVIGILGWAQGGG